MATKTENRTKKLQWAHSCSLVSIRSIHDMSNDEIRQTWYDRKDYRIFRKQIASTAKLVLKARKSNQCYNDILMKLNLCDRGIEHIVDVELGTAQSKLKKTAVNVVLEEQSDQRHFGTVSPDFLAELYEDVSVQSRYDAYLKGLQDEEYARSCTEAESIQALKISDTFRGPIKPFLLPYGSSSEAGRCLPTEGMIPHFLVSRTA